MTGSAKNSERRRKKGWQRIVSSPWFHLLLSLSLIAVFHGFVLKPYVVPSGSMETTLEVGDRIYAKRFGNPPQGMEQGTIVVFNASDNWQQQESRSSLRTFAGNVGDLLGFGPTNHHSIVKRLIGLPGDTVECCSAQGTVMVNGKSIDEPYVFDDYPFATGALDCKSDIPSLRCFDPIKVGSNQYLVMGDHRSNSSDSVIACREIFQNPPNDGRSCARFAAADDIVGDVVLRVWPLSRIGKP